MVYYDSDGYQKVVTPCGTGLNNKLEDTQEKSLYNNVGRATAGGAPIKREMEAIYDLEDAGIDMYFVGYD